MPKRVFDIKSRACINTTSSSFRYFLVFQQITSLQQTHNRTEENEAHADPHGEKKKTLIYLSQGGKEGRKLGRKERRKEGRKEEG